MNVAFDTFDDKPSLVLDAVERATQLPSSPAKSLPEPKSFTMQPEVQPLPPAEDSADEPAVAAIHPEGPSAEQLFREGQIHLNTGNKAAAYQAFLKAYQSGQKLDARRGQQLQDYLRELHPRRTKPIQLAGSEGKHLLSPDAAEEDGATDASEPGTLDPQRPIDIVSERQKVQLDRVRNEVFNAVYRAERVKEKDPAKAIEILDQAMANLEGSPLDKRMITTLTSHLRNSRASIESLAKLQEPNLIQKKQNEEVKASIQRDIAVKVRAEREYAILVRQFNELMDQKRFAEAEVIAKQAKDLDSENPISETMTFKATFARRNDNNDKLRAATEAGFSGALDSVDWSDVPFDDRNALRFGKDWN